MKVRVWIHQRYHYQAVSAAECTYSEERMTYVIFGLDLIDIAVVTVICTSFQGRLQARLIPVHAQRRAVDSPSKQVVGSITLNMVESKFVLRHDRRRNCVGHERHKISLVVASSAHSNTSAGRLGVWSSRVVKNGPQRDTRLDDLIPTASSADRNSHPVVAFCLIRINDDVVSLA